METLAKRQKQAEPVTSSHARSNEARPELEPNTAHILGLQHTIGNRGVQRSGAIQKASALEQSTTPAERKKLRILTTESLNKIAPEKLRELFTEKPIKAPVDNVKFGSNIDGKIQPGLESVAAEIIGREKEFIFNSLTNVPLDLTPFGGTNGVYRFTLIQRNINPPKQLVIEQVSSIPAAGPGNIDLEKEKERFAKFGFMRGTGFDSDAEYQHLLRALNRVPDSILKRIQGVKFEKSSNAQQVGDNEEAGHYDPNTHTIKLFGAALTQRGNSPDAGGADTFTAALTHELGHAADSELFVKARIKRDKLAEQLATAQKESRRRIVDPKAPLPDKQAEEDEKLKETQNQAKIKKLQDDLNQANNEFAQVAERRSMSQEFNTAQGNPISKYGAKAPIENFAELFSIYILDPNLLKSLRPDAYQYFSKTFT